MANVVQTILEVVDKNASKGFKDFKADVADAEGAVGKAKTGISGGLNFVKDHAAAFAVTAGAAIAGFAAKGVADFGNLGLEVSKFATTTSTSSETASKWVEVAGDLGVSSDAVATSFAKMEKQLGQNADAFEKYGLQVVKTKDGQLDASATYLNAIQLLHDTADGAKRAEIGAALFGKGWTQTAALVDAGAADISARLDSVDKAKIFSDEKVQQAKNLRDGFDSLKDSLQQIALTAGSALAPSVAQAATTIGNVLNKLQPAFAAVGKAIATLVDSAAPALEGLAQAVVPVLNVLGKISETVTKVAFGDGMNRLPKGFDEAAKKAAELGINVKDWDTRIRLGLKSLKDLNDEIEKRTSAQATVVALAIADIRDKFQQIADVAGKQVASNELARMYLEAQQTGRGIDGINSSLAQAYLDASKAGRGVDKITTAADEAKGAVNRIRTEWETLTGELDQQQATLNLKQGFKDVEDAAVAAWTSAKKHSKDAGDKQDEYVGKVLDLKQKIIDYGKTVDGLTPSKVTELFAMIDAGKLADVQKQLDDLTKPRDLIVTPRVGGTIPRYASGTANHPGGPAIINDAGPEIVDLPNGSRVYPAGQSAAMMAGAGGSSGGGGDTVIHTGVDPNMLYSMLRSLGRKGFPNPFVR